MSKPRSGYRSRTSAGNRQGRSGVHAERFKAAVQTKRIDESRRAGIHEIGDARRASVYRTDVEFAPEDHLHRKLPARGTAARSALVAEVVRLRRTGLSHMKIGNALDPMWSSSTVGNLLREAGEK